MTEHFLDGLKVLELAHMTAGPLAARRLCDLGAQVIKVEPKGGDVARFHAGPPGNSVDGDHLRFHMLSGGKRSIELDFKLDADREVAVRLAREADVIIQNFRAGVLDKYGLGYEQLKAVNPGLVYASVNGFGPGVWRDDPGQDLLAQARSGLMWLSGTAHQGPVAMGNIVIDIMAGNLLAQGILAAVAGSRATGQGAHVETSLLEAALELQFDCLPMFLNRRDALPKRSLGPNSGHPELGGPYGMFATADGHVAVSRLPDDLMAEILGAPAPPAIDGLSREEYRDIMFERLAPKFKARTTAYWIEAFAQRGGWISEVLDWEQLERTEGFADLRIMAAEPDRRGVRVMRPTIRFDGERPAARVAPKLNEHDEEVRRLGWA
jgi:crotonobetainyl-CoA:carnitine CoA-transferase CaiB-like acyl-CoA transferase